MPIGRAVVPALDVRGAVMARLGLLARGLIGAAGGAAAANLQQMEEEGVQKRALALADYKRVNALELQAITAENALNRQNLAPFTLGQTRFTGTGEEIASLPAEVPLTPEEKGLAASAEEIAQARATGVAQGKTGDELKAFIAAQFKQPEAEAVAPDEFNRNIARYRELLAIGQGNSMEAQFILGRLNRQTAEDTGEIITVSPEGQVTITRGGAQQPLITGLTPQKALQQKALADRYDTVIDIIDTTISLIQEDPTRAGIIGGVRAFAQGLAGVAVDTVEGLATFVGTSIADIPGIDKDDVQKLAGFFDPALPEMEIYENTIALELAKIRILSGGQGIRALTKAFEAAKEDVNIVGVFSSREALSRLQTVRREMDTERTNLLDRVFKTAPEPSPTPTDIPEFNFNPDTGLFERAE